MLTMTRRKSKRDTKTSAITVEADTKDTEVIGNAKIYAITDKKETYIVIRRAGIAKLADTYSKELITNGRIKLIGVSNIDEFLTNNNIAKRDGIVEMTSIRRLI